MAPIERLIVGQGESGRLYVVHTHAPRFIAELFAEDEAPASGVSLALPETGEVLSNFAWIDDPAGHDLLVLRQAVAEFLIEADFRGDAEIDAALRREELDD